MEGDVGASDVTAAATLAVRLTRGEPYARAILRIVTGLLFWFHGAQKLFGWFDGRAVTDLTSLRGLAGVLEFFGGILFGVGFLTRPVAFVLSGEMAVAYWMSHFPRGAWPIVNRGESAALFCFIFLFFVFAGAGAWAVDRLRK